MLRTLAQTLLPRALARAGCAAERALHDGVIACSGGTSTSSTSSSSVAARAAAGGAAASPGRGGGGRGAAAGCGCGCARCRPSVAAVAGMHTTSAALHGGGSKTPEGETISVTFIDKDGAEATVRAPLGKSLLEVAHDNDVELEGACEGSLACSTCHVILDPDVYAKLEEPCEDELDMLDLAFGLTPTSRLGCQVMAAPGLDGMRVRLPSATRNFYVGDGDGDAVAAGGGAGEKAAAASAAAAAAAAAAK